MQQITFHKRVIASSLGRFTTVGAMTSSHGRFAQSSSVGMNQGQVLPSLKSCSALLNQSVTVRTLCASCRTGHVHP